jgi:hypothetical protein
MFYERKEGYFVPTGENYCLAGHNLIHSLWIEREKPVDKGWHISGDDLVKAQTKGRESASTRALLIDFHPSSRERIGVIELLDIYAYTYAGDEPGSARWTPMMLRIKDIFYSEDPNTEAEKARCLERLVPNQYDESVEFLYLNGCDKSWNWGRNGMTNAAFIGGDARVYFRKFF